jgi:hypothetical protein
MYLYPFKNFIKIKKLLLVSLAAFYYSSHASATPLIGTELASFSVLAGSYATYGANTTINGNVGAVGYITAGANAMTLNNYSGAAITYGAGASSLSTNAVSAVTIGELANAGAVGKNISSLEIALTQFNAAKSALNNMENGRALDATISGNILLAPGLYISSALTTAAGTIITLDGKGMANPYWVFNINTYLVTGANTEVQFAAGTTNASVFWNTGGYTTLGADTSLLGVVLSSEYIVEGAGATIACGNAFSLSYVGVGADGATSASDCAGSFKGMSGGLHIVNGIAVASPVSEGSDSVSLPELPEPNSYALLLVGLGMMGVVTRRRKNKDNAWSRVFIHKSSKPVPKCP